MAKLKRHTCSVEGCDRSPRKARGFFCRQHCGFFQHKKRAARRGIPFRLSFEQWWRICERSGHWEERGNRRGQYCMARHGDRGGYEVGNVKIITHSENASEGNRGERNGQARPTPAQVLAIRAQEGKATFPQIATEFGISPQHVFRILRRKQWAWLKPPRVRLVEKQPLVWETPVVKLYRVFLNDAARERLAA